MLNINKFKNLINKNNIAKGDLHFHSLHSGCQGIHEIGETFDAETACGIASIIELSEIIKLLDKQNIEYLAVTNHPTNPNSTNKSNATEVKILKNQNKDLERLNKITKTEIIKGAEVNIINAQGHLSLSNQILSKLDLVIASNHRNTKNLSKANIINGFTSAIKNKNVHIIGHLTRFIKKLNKNDWIKILNTIKKENKILEYNTRSPLPPFVISHIIKEEILISIGSDIHPEIISEDYFNLNSFAKKYTKDLNQNTKDLIDSGINKESIINTYTYPKLKALLKKNIK